MKYKPRHYSTTSVMLSRVLDDIGLNTRTIERRQQTYLKLEKLSSQCYHCNNQSLTIYHFGSQIEGSTVDGLRSDIDTLYNRDNTVVIQHPDEWIPNKRNLLILNDSNIPGAYCRLQLYRDDMPLPAEEAPNYVQYEYDYRGLVLLRNSCMFQDISPNMSIHGPAMSSVKVPERIDIDSIYAYTCRSWPEGAQAWLERVSHGNKQWPSSDIAQFVRNSGCFLVPVGYRVSGMKEVEWRISPSLAEKRLMLSMNVVQMKCYVLLKMIKKQFIVPICGEVLSSYIMKTALFYMMEKTSPTLWREENLLVCVQQCLLIVFLWLSLAYCPNYFFPDENLFTGKHCARNKVPATLVKELIQSEGLYLLELECDKVGRHLFEKLSARLMPTPTLLSKKTVSILGRCHYSLTFLFVRSFNEILFKRLTMNIHTFIDDILQMILHITRSIETGEGIVRDTMKSYITYFTALLGSVLASSSLSKGNGIPDNAIALMEISYPADRMSVRLKLASIYYCGGQYRNAITILEIVESNYEIHVVQPICGCYDDSEFSYFKHKFSKRCSVCTGHAEVRQLMACCVIFTPQELYSCPPELRIEMSRNDDDEDGPTASWMSCAAIDSIVLLYYLQYITYRQRGDFANKKEALDKLETCLEQEEYTLRHRETGFNVLGQCLEYEGRYDEAIYYFSKSNKLRPDNNVAGWHSTVWHINNLKRGKQLESLFEET